MGYAYLSCTLYHGKTRPDNGARNEYLNLNLCLSKTYQGRFGAEKVIIKFC